MKSKKQVSRSLIILFVGTMFCSQFIGLSIINKIGEYEQTVGFILIVSSGLTAFFCTEYLLVRALYYKLRKRA